MQTIPASFGCWLEFKSVLLPHRASRQPGTRNPGRLNFICTTKPNALARLAWNRGKLVASFGAARLIRHRDGRWELSGGSSADHAAAREWCSLFRHEATFPSMPSPATLLHGHRHYLSLLQAWVFSRELTAELSLPVVLVAAELALFVVAALLPW